MRKSKSRHDARRSTKAEATQGTLSSFLNLPRTISLKKHILSGSEEDDQEDYRPTAKSRPKVKSKSTIDSGANVKGPMDMRHLPPISDLDEMFSDLVNNPALA